MSPTTLLAIGAICVALLLTARTLKVRSRRASTEATPVDATRRSLLTGSVATLGAVGVGLGSALTGVAYAEGPVTLGRVSKKMKLKGRNWRYRKGESGRGDCYGELLDEHGEKVGNFYSTNLGMKAPFEDDAMSSGMEFQIFSLASGTIFGMGLGAHEEETDGAYSIIGGTGSYSNHGGSYVGKQHSLEFGGDGSAEFSFSLSR